MSEVAVDDDSSRGRAADTERDGNEADEALTRAERRAEEEEEEEERGEAADCLRSRAAGVRGGRCV